MINNEAESVRHSALKILKWFAFGQYTWAMRTELGLLRSRVPSAPSLKTNPRWHSFWSFCLLNCSPKMEPSSAQTDFIACCELGRCFPMPRPWVTRQKLRSSRPLVAASGLLNAGLKKVSDFELPRVYCFRVTTGDKPWMNWWCQSTLHIWISRECPFAAQRNSSIHTYGQFETKGIFYHEVSL